MKEIYEFEGFRVDVRRRLLTRAGLGVLQYYRQRGQLTVEKPVLDDTGDGVGKDAGSVGPDGAIVQKPPIAVQIQNGKFALVYPREVGGTDRNEA